MATNHFDTIDPTAQRPGRFDFKIQIMPPSYDEKMRLARESLGPLFHAVEADLRRQPYQDNIGLAIRNEMLVLCDELGAAPSMQSRSSATSGPS